MPSFDVPQGIRATIALDVAAVTANGQTLRDIVFDGSMDNGVLVIDQASLGLPGSGRLAFTGLITGANALLPRSSLPTWRP